MPSTRALQGKRKDRNVLLPTPGTKNWGVRMKTSVVIGIRNGVITPEEACIRYMLSIEELAEWEAGLNEYGTRHRFEREPDLWRAGRQRL
jgi:hypothetical protein